MFVRIEATIFESNIALTQSIIYCLDCQVCTNNAKLKRNLKFGVIDHFINEKWARKPDQ